VDTSVVMAKHEVAALSSADLYLAAASPSGKRPQQERSRPPGKRAASIEYSRSKAHRLKSVDGSQSVLRGRPALAAISAITVPGQPSPTPLRLSPRSDRA
jgi:hypothetical protein